MSRVFFLSVMPAILLALVFLATSQQKLKDTEEIRMHNEELQSEISKLQNSYNSSEYDKAQLQSDLELLMSKFQDLHSTIKEHESLDEANSFGYLPSNGEWVHEPNKTFAAPMCCSWDKRQYLQNPEVCGTSALSVYEMVGRKEYLAQTGGHGCACDNFRDEYTWSGIDKKWNANETCRQLGNRTVLMIGDSTMGQAAATLMNALHPSGCQTQFTYSVSDTLVGREMGNMNRGEKWTDLARKYNPDIVILSAGPHIYNRSNFEIVLNHVVMGTKELKESKPQIEVVWKTQQPAGCTDSIVDEIMLSTLYQYDEFYERDLYALAFFPHHGIHVIDIRMLYYRSDAHVGDASPGVKRDCMHLCMPGPLDIIASLFSELLEKL